jgi:DNA-binding transcriptional regulator YdaS (Cro superfamily)
MVKKTMAYLPTHVKEAVSRAVAIAGSEVKLAAACGVSQPAISKAKLKGKISASLAMSIHLATNGQVPASELRPDLWRSPENVPVTTGSMEDPSSREGLSQSLGE